ncbi:MAG: cation-transporting P-type ATPase [Dehalococcoidia bacterium]|nr:cation-transporting P-type ATPase [Dehalococcoidia bacterium]
MARRSSSPPAAPRGPEPDFVSALPPDQVYPALGSSPAGLDDNEALVRARAYGPNRIEELPGPSLGGQLLAQFLQLFALLLWAGSLLAFLIGEAFLGGAIIAVVIINGAFGVWQERRAEHAVAALKRLLPETVRVLRQGREVVVPADALVPGDVILLNEGDRISADARLVFAEDLRVDESNLTGEAHPVHKVADPEQPNSRPLLQCRNLAFAGSSVISGSATAIVLRTGMTSEFGKIAGLTQMQREGPSPLQVEVGRVARRVAALSVGMGGLFFGLGYGLAGLPLRDGAVFAIGIVLANVPEGLLPTMTLSLAMGVQRMAARRAIVKRLSAVETLGSCTVICTDKTGTITENRMTVRELWVGGNTVTLSGAGYEPRGEVLLDGRPVSGRELDSVIPLLRIGSLCNAARLEAPGVGGDDWRALGDPTEAALLVAAAKAGVDRDTELSCRPLVRKLAFDPRRKRMSTIHRQELSDYPLVAYVKGAPRELLAHCSRILIRGRECDITEKLATEVMAGNDHMARSGLRVLAMAYRGLADDLEQRLASLDPGEVERDMVFVGLAGMEDPPRDEVPDAVEKCHAAGIRVVMVTGDYSLTAESIAREARIIGDGPVTVIESRELAEMSEEELTTVLTRGQLIFARATPEDKLRIVAGFQAMGEVVAVTGDGVNDAPALKKADIGVAMGMSGTDVAREAADMILVDDNFATIVAAIEEGRGIFDNMRKFIVYVFAHLSPEAVPFIFFALFRIPLPITAMQILAIDLGTETLPALALGTERPEPDVMRRPPRRRSERLLDVASLVRGYAFLGLITAAVVLGSYFLLLRSSGWSWGQSEAPSGLVGDRATTVVFLGIVVMQIGVAFACRGERVSAFTTGLFTNRFLLFAIAAELLFAAAVIYVPFLQPVFGTASLPWHWWLLPAAFVPVVFLADEVRKLYLRRRISRPLPSS